MYKKLIQQAIQTVVLKLRCRSNA